MAARAAGYRRVAEAAATDVLAGLGSAGGRLRRSWTDGRATADGVLEDYANLAEGLLALYEATFDERWYLSAVELAESILARFADPAGGFFDTPDDAEVADRPPQDDQDNATPSGGAMATIVLLRLAALTGDGRYRTSAETALARVGPYLGRYPGAFAQWLCALELALAPVGEVAVVGDPADPATRRLLDVVDRGYRPFRVVAVTSAPATSAVPLAPRPLQPARAPDRVRVPRLRLPPAGHRTRGACGPAGHSVSRGQPPLCLTDDPGAPDGGALQRSRERLGRLGLGSLPTHDRDSGRAAGRG